MREKNPCSPPALKKTFTQPVWSLVFGVIVALNLLSSSESPAQQVTPNYDEMELQELFQVAGDLMEDSEWEKAIVPLELIISKYGESAVVDYGPMFGVMHYRLGFCLKNLKRFDEALAAYETCFKVFENGPQTPVAKKNPVWELSRLEMGIVRQAMGDYEGAILDYEGFAARPAAPGSYDDVAFRIQAASCYTRAGKPGRARELIEQLFQNPALASRSDALMRALLTIAETWVLPDDREALAKEGHGFLDLYQDKFSVGAYDMERYDFNNRLLSLARKASENKQQTLAIRLLGMMKTSSDVLEDLQARAHRMLPAVSEGLEKEIEKYKARKVDPESVDWVAQLTLAGCYERSANSAGAFAIHQRCIQELPKSPHRELFLFGGMRTAMALRHMVLAQNLGSTFRKEFPDSKFAPIVATMMLESLFFSGEYSEAMRLALGVREGLEVGSEDRDLPDFVVGASMFYLNQIRDSQPELESHAKNYPKSRFAEPVRYFNASTFQRLGDFARSGELLDEFLKDFPNSDYLGPAMLDRGTCYFQVGEYDKCLEILGELQKRLPEFANLDSAVAIRGDAHLMKENHEQAEASYLKARELALAAGEGHEGVISRVLVQLIRTAKTANKPQEAIQYYDEYMKDYKGGFYDADIVVSAMDPLEEAGRGEEALNELQQVIIRLGSSDAPSGIEEAIGSYIEKGLEVFKAEGLLSKLEDFVPRGTEVNNTLRAWLIMARVDLLQKPENKDLFPRRDAQVAVAFEELRKFDMSELATYILVQVGRNLAGQGKPETDALAVQWFDAVLERGTSDHYPLALMGKARILASSGDPGAFDDALVAFDRVIRELEDRPEYVEEAMVSKGRLLFDKKKWPEAVQVFNRMQENKSFSRFRAEVFFKLARSYEEQGKTQEALDFYTPFVAPPLESFVEYSAEARVRAAEINMKSGDNKKAFAIIKDTVSRMFRLTTHPVAGPHVTKAKELYRKLKADTQAPDHPDEGVWGVR